MTGAQYLFKRFIVFDSGIYMELGMRTRHDVHGSGIVVFQMEPGDVL